METTQFTPLNKLQTLRFRQAKDTHLRLTGVAQRDHHGNSFGQHGLIATMRVDVDGRHEAALTRVRMNPAQLQQVAPVRRTAVPDEFFFVGHAHGVRRAFLLGDDEGGAAHESCLVLHPGEDTAGFDAVWWLCESRSEGRSGEYES